MKYTKEEVQNSKRIFKSATPKQTLDWYIKWVASAFVLAGMSMRGLEGFQLYDLIVCEDYVNISLNLKVI